MAHGHTSQEVADRLVIGFGTAESHRRNLMAKLSVGPRAATVRWDSSVTGRFASPAGRGFNAPPRLETAGRNARPPAEPSNLGLRVLDSLCWNQDSTDDRRLTVWNRSLIPALPDSDLKGLIDELEVQERELSYQRRLLHGKIDILRAELVARLQTSGGRSVLDQVDVDRLTEILTGKSSSAGER